MSDIEELKRQAYQSLRDIDFNSLKPSEVIQVIKSLNDLDNGSDNTLEVRVTRTVVYPNPIVRSEVSL